MNAAFQLDSKAFSIGLDYVVAAKDGAGIAAKVAKKGMLQKKPYQPLAPEIHTIPFRKYFYGTFAGQIDEDYWAVVHSMDKLQDKAIFKRIERSKIACIATIWGTLPNLYAEDELQAIEMPYELKVNPKKSYRKFSATRNNECPSARELMLCHTTRCG
ncbi:hypothetical protein P152DRAFT_480403 [Eremomyces bilateralis CBS 781.70]|uniref:Uncharacterized protein n=1 Tax=Eremomyces bilateralis CBS 781.70 TaxID=1392243 RepID=A0A6G1G8D2_9PEZI|nr:uncharacterized protein P152DRAFT_480403 [Eremomyces bilateralis CBS 781.70]KAF1814181.1 hypothetical protein P152DRAFT_480403 [Eremomyces bilateralis CBS 781.70]